MRRRESSWTLRSALAALAAGCLACGRPDAERPTAGAGRDAGFAGVQRRGETVMGVNQYTSRHVFEPLADGGRIELQRSVDDSAGAAQIRRHIAIIARQFAAGDFRLPGVVHARDVPGTRVMADRRSAISYTVESLPRGAAVRVRTRDTLAVRAIHEFLAFQRQDHRASAHRDS
jgi:hypothetical protein